VADFAFLKSKEFNLIKTNQAQLQRHFQESEVSKSVQLDEPFVINDINFEQVSESIIAQAPELSPVPPPKAISLNFKSKKKRKSKWAKKTDKKPITN